MVLGIKIRNACSALIYRKILKLDKSNNYLTSVGQTLNLLSNDVKRFDNAFLYLPYLFFITPSETTISAIIFLVYQNYVAFTGIVFLFVFAFIIRKYTYLEKILKF